jgi:hypothetical protein
MGVEWRGEVLRFARMSFGCTNALGLLTLLIKETLRSLREIGIAVVTGQALLLNRSIAKMPVGRFSKKAPC